VHARQPALARRLRLAIEERRRSPSWPARARPRTSSPTCAGGWAWYPGGAVACSGHGLCAELLPELVHLDEWGYLVLSAPDVPAWMTRAARRAVASCPALALQLTG
jgi:ferredoxin